MTSMRMKQIVLVGAFVAILVIGGGVAAAGGGIGGDQDAFLNDVAKRLNVTPAALKAAVKGASDARIDAAVAAGKITKEQGDAMKKRTAEGGVPFLGGGQHGFGGPHGGPGRGFGDHGPKSLAAAAKYLGLTEAELHAQLESGKTLAQIAKDKGKTVDGLEKALTADTKAKLDAAVKDGKITQAQADDLLKAMTDRLDDVVNGKAGPGMHLDGHGFGPGLGGPPPGRPGASVPQGSGNFTPVPAGSNA
jgi:predicted transcriptional regulator